MATPIFNKSFSSVHLSAATSAVSGAIQSTRYRAVVSGCQYQIVFSQGTTTYQLTTQALSGNPASCPSTESFTNVGSAVPWSGTGDGITLQASTTFQFFPPASCNWRAAARLVALPTRSDVSGCPTGLQPARSTFQESAMLRLPARKRVRSRGFSMIEVVTALAVLWVGVLCAEALGAKMLATGRQSRYMALASVLASEKLEDLNHYSPNDPQVCVPSANTSVGSLTSDIMQSTTCARREPTPRGSPHTVTYYDNVSIGLSDFQLRLSQRDRGLLFRNGYAGITAATPFTARHIIRRMARSSRLPQAAPRPRT